jgi:hypothetical protein
MGKWSKQPRAHIPAHGGKNPRGGILAPNVNIMNFKWRCDRLDWNGPWSWDASDVRTVLSEVIPRLHDFENMTWSQIEGPTGSHFVDCDALCKDAQDRLDQINELTDQMFSLRVTAKHRVWGIRDIATLRLIWWDPDHSVCPSEKKNT